MKVTRYQISSNYKKGWGKGCLKVRRLGGGLRGHQSWWFRQRLENCCVGAGERVHILRMTPIIQELSSFYIHPEILNQIQPGQQSAVILFIKVLLTINHSLS